MNKITRAVATWNPAMWVAFSSMATELSRQEAVHGFAGSIVLVVICVFALAVTFGSEARR